MTEPEIREINVDDIMQKIREEVARRKQLSQSEPFQETAQLVPKRTTLEGNAPKKSFDHFLWKYGNKYKQIVKRVPVVKGIARKQQARLGDQFTQLPPIPKQSLPGQLGFDVLPYYINYHGFLVQVKEREGLKGRIKSFLFKFIRFFAWWQEQINRALYQELMAHKTRMDERDAWVQKLHHQQMDGLKVELSERDKRIEALNDEIALFSRARGELNQKLEIQIGQMGEVERRVEGLLKKQSDYFRDELAKRDKILENLGNRFNLFSVAGDELSRELSEAQNKIDETRNWIESDINQQIDEIRSHVAERDIVVQGLNNRLVQFSLTEEEFSRGLNAQQEKLGGMEKHIQDLVESTRKELSALPEVKSDITGLTDQVKDQGVRLLDQQRRLALLLKEEDHLLDAMYVALEDRFRGPREEIKERLKVYLPYLRQTEIGKEGSLILDVGCGRGEWLDLLRENGYIGKGVDFNRVMVKQCQDIGLDVTESDMVAYLRSQPPNSLGAITGFHVIEHLSRRTLIAFIDEAFRVLRPGGIVIFETPNPENLIVAACNFHFDPTHQHLLPPGLLTFLIEARGFGQTEVLRLHPLEFFRGEQEASAAVEALVHLFNMEQDYSTIAYKG